MTPNNGNLSRCANSLGSCLGILPGQSISFLSTRHSLTLACPGNACRFRASLVSIQLDRHPPSTDDTLLRFVHRDHNSRSFLFPTPSAVAYTHSTSPPSSNRYSPVKIPDTNGSEMYQDIFVCSALEKRISKPLNARVLHYHGDRYIPVYDQFLSVGISCCAR